MQEIYPLKVIVSNDAALTEAYNTDIQSMHMVSRCMSAAEVESLFNNVGSFNHIILVDGEGEDLVRIFGQATNWDPELMPNIRKVSSEENCLLTIQTIHHTINRDDLKNGMG